MCAFRAIRNRVLNRTQQLQSLINRFVEQYLCRQYRAMIVMFHHVSDDALDDVIPSCKCKISDFEKIVNFIKEDVVSLDNLLLQMRKGNYRGRRYVITFDDVPEDFYHNAYPRLVAANLPFTLYVTYDYIGLNGYLSHEQLCEIANSPLATIGAHTMSHPMLCGEGVDLKEEVNTSRDELAVMLNREIRHFAYPYGSMLAVSKRVVDFVKRADFDSAVVTLPGYLNPFTTRSLYRLPRVHNELFMSKYMDL